jgi:hypothetical protein
MDTAMIETILITPLAALYLLLAGSAPAAGPATTSLARGLSEAASLRSEESTRVQRGPAACDATRLNRLVGGLAAGLHGGEARGPALVIAELEALALTCRDPGSLAALTAAILAAHPDAAGARPGFELDKVPAGLTGAIILRQVGAELAGPPPASPTLTRRARYRWLIEAWHKKDPRFIHQLDGQRLCRALLSASSGLERTGGGAGVVLADLVLVARVGGLHYLPVVDPASAWVPWLANAKLSPVELATLRGLEASAGQHADAPGIALFAFKLRAVLALREAQPCARARALAVAINRLAGTAQEIDRGSMTGLVEQAARKGLEAVNQCPDGGFLLRRELAAVLGRIAESGQPFPVAYDFIEP